MRKLHSDYVVKQVKEENIAEVCSFRVELHEASKRIKVSVDKLVDSKNGTRSLGRESFLIVGNDYEEIEGDIDNFLEVLARKLQREGAVEFSDINEPVKSLSERSSLDGSAKKVKKVKKEVKPEGD